MNGDEPLPWTDPKSNPVEDIKKFIVYAKANDNPYEGIHIEYIRSTGTSRRQTERKALSNNPNNQLMPISARKERLRKTSGKPVIMGNGKLTRVDDNTGVNLFTWSCTKTKPWEKRAKRRAANKVANKSRARNR